MSDDEAMPADTDTVAAQPSEAAADRSDHPATPADDTTATAQLADAATDRSDHPAELDLEEVARDLDGVEAALARLDQGTYWTDEATGEPIPDAVLAADPVARRTEDSR